MYVSKYSKVGILTNAFNANCCCKVHITALEINIEQFIVLCFSYQWGSRKLLLNFQLKVAIHIWNIIMVFDMPK